MKKLAVIDANILLRFLTDDVPEMAEPCTQLLQRVERGHEAVFLPDHILADVIWTLEKHYHQPKARIREVMTPILNMRGLHLSSKARAFHALNLYVEENIDWSDAYVASWMIARGITRIYSYDRDFQKISSLERVQPGKE